MENKELQDRVDRFKRATEKRIEAFRDMCRQAMALAGDVPEDVSQQGTSFGEVTTFQPKCWKCPYRKVNCPATEAGNQAFKADYQRE